MQNLDEEEMTGKNVEDVEVKEKEIEESLARKRRAIRDSGNKFVQRLSLSHVEVCCHKR